MAKFLTLAFGLWLVALRRGPTAERLFGAQGCAKGADGSASLITITGERGAPQPQEWKVIFGDSAARGGIREIVTSGDVIVSQRTPLKGNTGVGSEPAIALTRLNLDSDGAFEIANKEAIAKKIGFSWVDYTLRANAVGGAPMWILRLYDSMGIRVGVIQISAENGSLIMPLEPTSCRLLNRLSSSATHLPARKSKASSAGLAERSKV